MPSALDKALAFADASYMRAKASQATVTQALLASTRSGLPFANASDMSKADRALREFRGWPYAAIRVIGQKIASQRVCVGKVRQRARRGMKGYQPDIDEIDRHAILDALADPNELGTSFSLMFCTVAAQLLAGRAFWYCPLIKGRRFVFNLPPSWVEGFTGTTSYESWRVRPPNVGEVINLPSEEVVYFPLPHPRGPHDTMSPLQAAELAVDADQQVQHSQRATFARGVFPGMAIILGKHAGADGSPTGKRPSLSEAQKRQLLDVIRKYHGGALNAGEPLILDAMIERIERLSTSPHEMDWTQSAESLKNRICQIFGVNPIILGAIEGANRASSLEAERHLCSYTVNPLIRQMSLVLTQWLAPMFGEDPRTFRVWIEECQPHDEQYELQRISLAAQYRAVTIDELRTFAGFEPLPGGEGNSMVGATEGIEAALQRGMDRRLGALAGEYVNRNFLGNETPTKAAGPATSTTWRMPDGSRGTHKSNGHAGA